MQTFTGDTNIDLALTTKDKFPHNNNNHVKSKNLASSRKEEAKQSFYD